MLHARYSSSNGSSDGGRDRFSIDGLTHDMVSQDYHQLTNDIHLVFHKRILLNGSLIVRTISHTSMKYPNFTHESIHGWDFLVLCLGCKALHIWCPWQVTHLQGASVCKYSRLDRSGYGVVVTEIWPPQGIQQLLWLHREGSVTKGRLCHAGPVHTNQCYFWIVHMLLSSYQPQSLCEQRI